MTFVNGLGIFENDESSSFVFSSLGILSDSVVSGAYWILK